MKSSLFIFTALALAGVAQAQDPGFCEAAGIRDTGKVRTFLSKLQEAVQEDDLKTVESMIAFPVGYAVPGGPLDLDENGFDQRYRKILTRSLKRILSIQSVEDLHCDTQGLAIGHGEIWIGLAPQTGNLAITHFYLSKYSRAGVESMSDTELLDNSFLRLQRAVQKDDRRTVTAMMEFPLRVETPDGAVSIRTPAELLERYDFVFSSRVKHALSNTRVSDLYATNSGIAIKGGIVWFQPPPVGGKWTPRVFAIANTG